MAFILCSSGAAIFKAGKNASSTATASGAILNQFSTEVEHAICTATRYDWITNIGSVTTNVSGVLMELSSDMIGMKIVNYDMSGYPSLQEAQTRLDVLRDNVSRNLDLLKEEKTKDYVK